MTDTGLGPSDDIAAVMFEPLVSDKPEGVGLGLAVVKDVVTKHHGTIHCDRRDDLTRLVVQLPLATLDQTSDAIESDRATRAKTADC